MELADALPFAARHARTAWPDALAVLVSGSVARGTATPTSDLDVLVLLPPGNGASVVTHDWEGTPVEVFAYDPDGLDRWLAHDTEQRRPTRERGVGRCPKTVGTTAVSAGRRCRPAVDRGAARVRH